MAKYLLKLYVTGRTANSERAVLNLHRFCESELDGEYEIVVIDILEEPGLAEEQKVLATPTLTKESPPPVRRLVGDLSDKDKIFLGLDLLPHDTSEGDVE